jgi:riboflavin kinase/FMN adenylyltransferase
MQLIRGQHNLHNRIDHCVVTLGNFDGVHHGHQKLIQCLQDEGLRLQLPTALITFEPQPVEFFSRQPTVPRLMRLSEKWAALEEYQIDYLICLRFNSTLAALSPDAFVSTILIEHLGAKSVIVGDDFRFGAKRTGDFSVLQTLSERYDFKAIEVPEVVVKEKRVSSSRIRLALQEGHMILAEQLLGRPYQLSGKVIHGDKRGRQLGFPTANINLHRKLLPVNGVFAVRVKGLGDASLPGVASIGTRPMFDGDQLLLEVFLFDFDQDIYGVNLQVDIFGKIRDEACFSSIDELISHMHQDVKAAKQILLNKFPA